MRLGFKISQLILIAIIGARAAAADAPAGDDFGCQHDEITDSYFCASGPLEGREFLTKSELDDAVQAWKAKNKEVEAAMAKEALPPPPLNSPFLKEDRAAKKSESGNLRVLSWNMKALAGEGSDFDRAALVLGEADVIALQEVDLHGQGKGFINVIANLIQAKTQEKYCRAWIQAENGDRQTHAFIWRESTVGYVDDGGAINETCGETAAIIRQAKKNKLASQATFYFKPRKKMFVLGNAFVETKPKTPEKSVTEIFKNLDDGKWPVLLAGDLKLGAGNSAFNGARKMGFRSAVSGRSKAWDNLWYRGVSLKGAKQIDLVKKFSDARKEDIEKDFSGIYPLMAEFSMKEEPPTDQLDLVAKPNPAPAAHSKKKSKSKSAKAAKNGKRGA